MFGVPHGEVFQIRFSCELLIDHLDLCYILYLKCTREACGKQIIPYTPADRGIPTVTDTATLATPRPICLNIAGV